MGTILGIDEAGRGPVLGPMVMCGVVVEEGVEEQLRALGVKDSKLLTPDERDKLYPRILALVKSYKIVVLEVDVIDAAIASSALNLNKLEAHTSADILNALNPDAAIIDCPSTNIKAYKDYVYHLLLNKKISLTLEHKAERHMPVAAASVLAKVTRDRIVEDIKKKIGIDFGSGYMSDEKTQKFLVECHEKHKTLFRTMWAPYQKALEKKHQKKLGEF